MKIAKSIPILLTILSNQFCESSTHSKELPAKSDSIPIRDRLEGQKDIVLQTHLKDTIRIEGSIVLFIIPDSLRFESLAAEPGIYDADSDFGVGASNTIDSISKNTDYRNIKAYTTAKRFVEIDDCKGCPIVIDRDSVNYGLILSSNGKELEAKYNEVHAGDYLEEINNYFGLKNNNISK